MQQKFDMVMECRNSGLSDYMWCRNHDIKGSTFYSWISQLKLSVDTPEKKNNSSVTDVALEVSTDGGKTWIPATAENFPAEGIRVVLNYPKAQDGTQTNGQDYTFSVAHLVGTTVGEVKAGTIETPSVTNTDNGIETVFHGLSPVMITWEKKETPEPTITAKITVDGKEYTATCKVTVVPTGSPMVFPSGGGEHTHKYVWDTIEATEDMDGELRYQCETCGDIKERVPLTAYNVFNKNATEKIRKAPKDGTVKIETNKWISFHKMVMEALAERPDVTLEISFLDEGHKGTRYKVVIPKGTDTKALVDNNGFTGFLFLGGKFGMTPQ